MAEFSKEGAELKRKFLKIYDTWEEGFYDGASIRKTPENPTGKGITKGRANRGLYSFLLSPDDVHLDYIDNRMSKGASVKSMMGGLGGRVQKLTSADQSAYGVIPTDSLHHQNAHNAYGRTARLQDQSKLRDFLRISSDQGVIYGEGAGNLKGTSLDSRSHTGSRGKPGKRFNPTLSEGPSGKTNLSAHPRGTTDTEIVLPNKQYGSGQEMFDDAASIRQQHKDDLRLGQAADQTRRSKANAILRENGVIADGVDVFSSDTDNESIRKAQKFFKDNEEAMTDVAKSFDSTPAFDLVKQRRAAQALAVAGLGGLSLLGTAASASETVIRADIATKTFNPLDILQTVISGASLAADFVPIAGEAVSTPADAINAIIDQERSGGAKKIRGRSGAKRAKELEKQHRKLNNPYGIPML